MQKSWYVRLEKMKALQIMISVWAHVQRPWCRPVERCRYVERLEAAPIALQICLHILSIPAPPVAGSALSTTAPASRLDYFVPSKIWVPFGFKPLTPRKSSTQRRLRPRVASLSPYTLASASLKSWFRKYVKPERGAKWVVYPEARLRLRCEFRQVFVVEGQNCPPQPWAGASPCETYPIAEDARYGPHRAPDALGFWFVRVKARAPYPGCTRYPCARGGREPFIRVGWSGGLPYMWV